MNMSALRIANSYLMSTFYETERQGFIDFNSTELELDLME